VLWWHRIDPCSQYSLLISFCQKWLIIFSQKNKMLHVLFAFSFIIENKAKMKFG